jgi:hypothetical protein
LTQSVFPNPQTPPVVPLLVVAGPGTQAGMMIRQTMRPMKNQKSGEIIVRF